MVDAEIVKLIRDHNEGMWKRQMVIRNEDYIT